MKFNDKEYIEGKPHDINDLLEIVAILRDPVYGCNWDKNQTHRSMTDCMINEANEVVDAINNNDDINLCEELGDVLFQVLIHSQIADERGAFSFADVIQEISDKMIRRHPHIFGDLEPPKTKEEGHARWVAIKEKEKQLKALKAKQVR